MAGAIALPLYVGPFGQMAFPIAVAVALALVFASRQPAMGGGLLLALGLWMTYEHFSMIQRCAEANSPTGSCTVIDASGTALPALTFTLAGVATSLYGLGKRSARGGE